jgi:hypothetical protein
MKFLFPVVSLYGRQTGGDGRRAENMATMNLSARKLCQRGRNVLLFQFQTFGLQKRRRRKRAVPCFISCVCGVFWPSRGRTVKHKERSVDPLPLPSPSSRPSLGVSPIVYTWACSKIRALIYRHLRSPTPPICKVRIKLTPKVAIMPIERKSRKPVITSLKGYNCQNLSTKAPLHASSQEETFDDCWQVNGNRVAEKRAANYVQRKRLFRMDPAG